MQVFFKRILKVKTSTVNFIVYCELGRCHMFVDWYYIAKWSNIGLILCTENCILKSCHEEMCERFMNKPNKKHNMYNWVCKIRDILYQYGFQDVWIFEELINWMHEFKVQASIVNEMNAFFNESSKCHLYRSIYDLYELQFNLDCSVNYIYKPNICKYRISAQCLNTKKNQFNL